MERRGRIRVRMDEARCDVCEQPPTLHISYHCVGCDGAVCALCVLMVHGSRDTWCPGCLPGEVG